MTIEILKMSMCQQTRGDYGITTNVCQTCEQVAWLGTGFAGSSLEQTAKKTKKKKITLLKATLLR